MKLIYIGIINFVTQRDRKNFLHLNTFIQIMNVYECNGKNIFMR